MAYLEHDPGYNPYLNPGADKGNGRNSGEPVSLPPDQGLNVNLPLNGVKPYVADVTRTDQARLGLVDRYPQNRADERGVGDRYGVFAHNYNGVSRGEGRPFGDLVGFNQAMWDTIQNIDPLIEKKLIMNPRFWHDRIPRGQFQLNNGAVQQSRIFRGGLQKYAGLDEWEAIDPVPSLTNDPCKFPRHGTYTYGWDQLAWSGMRAAWGSDPICSNAFRYIKDAAQQLSLILEVGMERGVQMQETFNRDTYLSKATDFGRSFVMTSAFHHYNDSPRYFYDPFVKFGNTGSSDTKTANKALVQKAFIVIDASAEIEPINWSLLDRIHELLKLRCPDAALGYDAGEPLFGLMVNSEDIDKSIEGDEKVYREWLEAKPLALIQKYNLSPKVYRRWAIVSDANQIRFKIKRYVADYNAEDYGGVAKGVNFKNGVYIAEAVDPFIADPDRKGVNGGPLPIENVDYVDAELAIAPVFMNDVLTNLFEAGAVNLGSGTHFGAYPALNGQWGWIKSPQSEEDPFQQTGKFYGLFAIHQKPEPRVRDVISFLYRRCKETIRARCPIESKRVNPDADSTVKTVASTVGLRAPVTVSGPTVTLPKGTVFDIVMGKGAGPAHIGEDRKLKTTSFGGIAVKVVDVTSFPYVSVATTTDLSATAANDSDSDSDSFPESYSGDLTELFELKEGSIPTASGMADLGGKTLVGGELA